MQQCPAPSWFTELSQLVRDDPINCERSWCRNFLHALLLKACVQYLLMNGPGVALVIVPVKSRKPATESIQCVLGREANQKSAG